MTPERPDNLEEQLSAYLDGEVTEAERAAVEDTLAASEDARRLLADMKRNAELLGSLPRAKAPDGLLELVSSQMERRELLDEERTAGSAPRPVGRGLGRWLASAAVVALAASAGFLTFTHLRQGRPQPTPGPLGPIAEMGERTRLAYRGETEVAPPAQPPVEESGRDANHAVSNGSSTSPAARSAGFGAGDYAFSDGASTERVAKAKGASRDLLKEEPVQRVFAHGTGRSDDTARMVEDRLAPVPRAAAPAPAKPAGPAPLPRLAKGGEGVVAGTAHVGKEGQQSVELGDHVQLGLQQTMAAPPASGGDGGFGGAANTFEIELVYADQAAKDAAVGVISHTLSRSSLTQSVPETWAVTSGPAAAPREAKGLSQSFSYALASSDVHADGSVITVEAPAETAGAAILAVEEAGVRTAPVSVSAQQGAAIGWPAVQSLGRAYVARYATSSDKGVEATLNLDADAADSALTAKAAPTAASPVHLYDSVTVARDAAATARTSVQQRPDMHGKLAMQSEALMRLADAPSSAPAKKLATQSAPARVAVPARANVPLEVGQAARPAAVPMGQQTRAFARGAAAQRSTAGERLQVKIRLLTSPETSHVRAGGDLSSRPASSRPSQGANR